MNEVIEYQYCMYYNWKRLNLLCLNPVVKEIYRSLIIYLSLLKTYFMIYFSFRIGKHNRFYETCHVREHKTGAHSHVIEAKIYLRAANYASKTCNLIIIKLFYTYVSIASIYQRVNQIKSALWCNKGLQ